MPRPPKVDVSEEFLQALREGAAIMRGEMEPARVHLPPDVPDVRAMRTRLGLSREAFAERFGLKVGAVREWEQGLRRPDPAARTLLKVIEAAPDLVERVVREAA